MVAKTAEVLTQVASVTFATPLISTSLLNSASNQPPPSATSTCTLRRQHRCPAMMGTTYPTTRVLQSLSLMPIALTAQFQILSSHAAPAKLAITWNLTLSVTWFPAHQTTVWLALMEAHPTSPAPCAQRATISARVFAQLFPQPTPTALLEPCREARSPALPVCRSITSTLMQPVSQLLQHFTIVLTGRAPTDSSLAQLV